MLNRAAAPEQAFWNRPSFQPIKRAIKGGWVGLGRATAALRPLPDFMIVGVQKGGTTSLWNYMRRHPNVAAAIVGEVHYFDVNAHQPLGWYRARMPSAPYVALKQLRTGRRPLVAECTPCYLFHVPVAARIAAVVPDVKSIAVLRDPVERAFSHYNHRIRKGTEHRSFAEAMEHELKLHADGWYANLTEADYAGDQYKWDCYLSRGLYADQIETWWKSFPRDQLLILSSDELFADPAGTVGKVTDYLGLPPLEAKTFPAYNAHGKPSAMDPALRQRLEAFFAEPNRRLAALLGREFAGRNETAAFERR